MKLPNTTGKEISATIIEMRSSRITHLSIPILLTVATLAACSSSSDTQASLTEPALTAADLVLNAEGIGPLMFGDAADSTIAALASALGTPTEDTTHEYTISCSSNSDACNGFTDGYTDEDGFLTFGYPIGRSVCFGNALCALFGGQTTDDLPFVGWTLGVREVSDGAPALLTADGITLGSIWADFEDKITVSGGCYVSAYGETSGVRLQLITTTGELYAPTGFADSTDVFVQPGPEVMAVEYLSAGEETRTIIGDCPG